MCALHNGQATPLIGYQFHKLSSKDRNSDQFNFSRGNQGIMCAPCKLAHTSPLTPSLYLEMGVGVIGGLRPP